MKKFTRRFLLILVLTTLAELWCQRQLQREDWIVSSDRIPAAFDGYRVCLLTDLHGRAMETELLQAVRDSAPDLIAISGDILDRYRADTDLTSLLTSLTDIAPTYYVTGNHEWDTPHPEQLISGIRDCGVTVLRNSWLELAKDGARIVLAGVEDPNAYADQMQPDKLVQQIRAVLPDDPYVMMLCHRNNTLNLWSDLSVDLVLAGHGHGGVVRLPFIGGLMGVDRRPFPDDYEGLYTKGRTTLAVSRGLGGLRFWNRPHLPTVVLKHVNNS